MSDKVDKIREALKTALDAAYGPGFPDGKRKILDHLNLYANVKLATAATELFLEYAADDANRKRKCI